MGIAALAVGGSALSAGTGAAAAPLRAPRATASWYWPFAARWGVTAGFGPRPSPGNGGSTNHKGIDIAAPDGTAIYAVGGGTVTMAQSYSGFGNHVRIDHGGGVSSTYSHLQNGSIAVAVGQRVLVGTRLGREGSTGNSTGAHLHFEIRINGVEVNPAPYIMNAPLNPGTPIEGDDDMTPEQDARMRNIESMLSNLQNAVNDPKIGILAKSNEASAAARQTNEKSQTIINWIEDPTRGLLKKLNDILGKL